MISIIDKYILKLFFGFWLAGLVVIVTLFTTVDFMTNTVRHNVSSSVLLEYYTYYLPEVVHLFLPVACLMATVFTLSSLAKNNEMTALFATGMSLARISAPILISVILIGGTGFWLSDRILPKFVQKKNFIYYVEIAKRPGLYSTIKTNKIWYRSKNIIFNIQSLMPEKKMAQGISMYYFDGQWELLQLITANQVELKGSQWTLKDGAVTLFVTESGIPMRKSFETKVISMNEEVSDLQNSAQNSNVLSLKQLRKFISKNKNAGLDTVSYEVDYHAKFSFAFSSFVMAFLGIPFSVGRVRSGGVFLNMGLCIGLAFVYWSLYSSGLTMGKHGLIAPLMAAWLPNGVIAFGSFLLLVRLKK